MASTAPATIERQTLVVDGVERSYWLAHPPAAGAGAPLLLAFHGLGVNGPHMATWTGLDVRGPAAGFATVFPEAWSEMWDDRGGAGRSDRIDDVAYVAALLERLVASGVARPGPAVLVGLSNGAFFIERLARHALVPVAGIVLVAGTARQASHLRALRPLQAAPVLCFAGTGDPMVPYGGGRGRGPLGWMARRRVRRLLVDPAGGEAVAVEAVAAEWAAVNGCAPEPAREPVPMAADDPPVERLRWSAPGRPPVELYRIEGGGHCWPGGPQYLPARLIGRAARGLDGTGILLEFARTQLAA